MNVRWWRIALLLKREGAPWTWTLHVRAFTEANARRLVAQRVREEAGDVSWRIYACQPSDPLLHAPRREEIVAAYGPYRRSWDDHAGLVRYGLGLIAVDL